MNGVLFIRGIPASVKRDFKEACAHHGISMTDAIIGLMKGWMSGCNLSTNSSGPGTSPTLPKATSTAAPAGKT